MGVRESGLTLEGLAKRLEALERENTELRSKVTLLEGSDTRRDKLADIRGSETPLNGEPVAVLEGPMSRRSLLSKAGAAAVAAMAAGTLLYPRQARAHDMGEPFIGNFVITHDISANQDVADRRAIDATNNSVSAGFATIEALNERSGAAVNGESKGSGPAVVGKGGTTGVRGIGGSLAGTGVQGTGTDSTGAGVKGISNVAAGVGVEGRGWTGVRGVGSNDRQAGVKGEGPTGVWGVSSKTSYSGVYGEHKGTSGIGTVGIGKGGDAGVLGRNESSDGVGVRGEGATGVHGQSTGTSGYGIVGDGTGSRAGVLGRGSEGVKGEGAIGVRGDGEVFGVRGESTQAGTSGIYGRNDGGIGAQGNGKTGVLGISSGGYGGRFEGGKAQLMLKPGASAGKPTSGAHSAGEIYMDSTGTLIVCVASSTATAAAKWKKLSAIAV